MTQAINVLVEVTGNHRSGNSKAGKPYCMFEGYVHLPGLQYPQKVDFYAQMPNEIPQTGTYECAVELDVQDGRLAVRVDPRKGTRKNIPPLSAAPKVAASS